MGHVALKTPTASVSDDRRCFRCVARLFHYWTLRLLAEAAASKLLEVGSASVTDVTKVLWESNLQVLLQVYIFLRQDRL